MKVIINGHAGHGKDFFADALAKECGLRKLNASLWFAEKVIVPAFPGMYACVEEAYQDRVNKRDLWYQMMRFGDWQQRFMERSDIFCGHRNLSEHEAMRSSGDYLCVWIEWVGKEPESPTSSQWQSDTVIDAMHDIRLQHIGDGVDHMVEIVKEALR